MDMGWWSDIAALVDMGGGCLGRYGRQLILVDMDWQDGLESDERQLAERRDVDADGENVEGFENVVAGKNVHSLHISEA